MGSQQRLPSIDQLLQSGSMLLQLCFLHFHNKGIDEADFQHLHRSQDGHYRDSTEPNIKKGLIMKSRSEQRERLNATDQSTSKALPVFTFKPVSRANFWRLFTASWRSENRRMLSSKVRSWSLGGAALQKFGRKSRGNRKSRACS